MSLLTLGLSTHELGCLVVRWCCAVHPGLTGGIVLLGAFTAPQRTKCDQAERYDADRNANSQANGHTQLRVMGWNIRVGTWLRAYYRYRGYGDDAVAVGCHGGFGGGT